MCWLTQQTGIAARLKYCKQQQIKRKQQTQQHKTQRKTQHTNTSTSTNTMNTNTDTDTETETETETETHPYTDTDMPPARQHSRQSVGRASEASTHDSANGINPYVSTAVPEHILDERIFKGVKQYLITWLNLSAIYDRFVHGHGQVCTCVMSIVCLTHMCC